MQCRDGQISTFFNKDTRNLFMLCIIFMCQLCCLLFIIVAQFYFCCSFILFVVQFSFILLFDCCSHLILLLFIYSLFIVQKEKDSILILDCIPGISILLYHCTRTTVIIYANQYSSYIRLHRLCLSIGASGLLRS